MNAPLSLIDMQQSSRCLVSILIINLGTVVFGLLSASISKDVGLNTEKGVFIEATCGTC